MQIEKINNNKIKAILNIQDLKNQNLNLNTFLSSPIESQELLFMILDEAQKNFNFYISYNSNFVVEAINIDNKKFILTISKEIENNIAISFSTKNIYYFSSNINLFNFYIALKKYIPNFSLYYYTLLNKNYLLIEKNSNINNFISEFAYLITPSINFELILYEHAVKKQLKAR